MIFALKNSFFFHFISYIFSFSLFFMLSFNYIEVALKATRRNEEREIKKKITEDLWYKVKEEGEKNKKNYIFSCWSFYFFANKWNERRKESRRSKKHQRRDICCVCERRAIFPMTNKIGFQIGGIISKMMMTVDRSFINREMWMEIRCYCG